MAELGRSSIIAVLGLVLAACGDSRGARDGSGGSGNGGGSAGTSAGAPPSAGSGGSSGGSAGGGGSAAFGERFEGIYTLDEITFNEGSCNPGGESLRDVIDDTHLVGTACSWPVEPCFAVASCAGPDACRSLATMLVQDPTAGDGLNYPFVAAGAGDTLTGTAIHPGTTDGTTCFRGGTEEWTLALEGTALTIELRGHLSDYPAEGGTCSLSAAVEQGQITECTRLTVVTGTRVGPLSE